MDTRIGQIKVTHSVRGIPSYTLELWHDGLKKHRLIRDGSQEVVRRKAQLQIAEWHERWSAADARKRELSEKASGKQRQEERKVHAGARTAEAQRELDQLSTLLAFTLTVNDAVDWEKLQDRSAFPEAKPALGKLPTEPQLPALPREPQTTDSAYLPVLSFFDKLISSRREQRAAEKLAIFKSDHEDWSRQVEENKQSHAKALKAHESDVRRRKDDHAALLSSWEQRKAAFATEQASPSARRPHTTGDKSLACPVEW